MAKFYQSSPTRYFLSILIILSTIVSPLVFSNQTSLLTINVPDATNNSKTLEYYLCTPEGQHQLTPGIKLILAINITHHISLGKFCILYNLTNVTITTQEPWNGGTVASIQCSVNSPVNYSVVTGRGFAFIGGRSLVMERLNITKCGGPISSSFFYNDTNLPVYFGAYQGVGLFFSHTLNLSLSNITISQYYGFAIAITNSFGTTMLSSVHIYDSLNHQLEVCTQNTHIRGNYSCYGSGLLIYNYNNDYCSNKSNHNLCPFWGLNLSDVTNKTIITDSLFHDNRNYIFDYICILNVFQFQPQRVPIVSAPALTVVFSQSQFNTSIVLKDSIVYQNYGLISGGILSLFIDTPFRSSFQLDNVTFRNNSLLNTCVGTAFITYIYFTNNFLLAVPNHVTSKELMETWTPLSVNNTTWADHVEQSSINRRSSTVYVALRGQSFYQIQVLFEGINFTNNSATYTGICLNANTIYEPMIGEKRLILILKNVKVIGNRQANGISSVLTNSSLFVFYRLERAIIETTPSFVSNFSDNLGSVIDAFSTEVYLKGNLIFSKNNATNGPAILLRSSSFLVLSNNTFVSFLNNTAFLRGGAIYSVEEGTEINDCILQIDSNSRNVNELNVRLTFADNLAYVAGNSLYMRPLQHCFQTKFHVFPRHLSDIYNRIFYFPTPSSNFSNNKTQISSIPVTFCKCNGKIPQCGQQFETQTIYPGATIQVTLVAKDENDLKVQSQVNASFSQIGSLSPLPGWWLEVKQEIRALIGSDCQTFQYTVLSNLQGDRQGRLNFAVPNKRAYTYVPITLKDCPPGMSLDDQGKCECKEYLNNFGLKCDTKLMTITKPKDTWVGIVTDPNTNSKSIAYSRYCPRMYCSSGNANNTLFLDDPNSSVCLNNREGMLCGDCKEGYSAVHGGQVCLKCDSYLPLLAIIGNLSVGIVLVIVVFVFKLTLDTGTTGGLIFYANVFDIVNTVPVDQLYAIPFVQLIQIINIQQSFPTCLYNGMHYYIDIIFHFVYSVYLWVIVFVIVLIAQCSTKISRLIMKSSVQVLMTIIHLSFIKLLVTSIDVFVFTSIQTENSTYMVWLYNGSIHYGTGLHIPLLLTASLFTVCVLIPYMSLAVCGLMCFRFSCINKLRPFLDTIYGPYKDKYRYWFGLRLILLTVIAILTASLRGPATFYQYLIQIIILTLFTLFQAYLKPFKHNWANLLDNWCMINVLWLLFINMYRIYGGEGSSAIMLASLVILCMTIIAVLSYHILIFIKSVRTFIRQKCNLRRSDSRTVIRWNQQGTTVVGVTNQSEGGGGGGTYSSTEVSSGGYKNYRESLLQYVDSEDYN